MKAPMTWILTGLSLGLVGLVGISYLVSAAPTTSLVTVMPERSKPPTKEASDGDGETNDDAQKQQESGQLQALAKITPQQARQSAIAAHPGQVSHVELENEDGNLVYAVAIGQQAVKVDAGNGKVLYADRLHPEKDASIRPRSSIQIAKPTEDDSNAEIQDHESKHPRLLRSLKTRLLIPSAIVPNP
jgi:Peptidase propeptide and YPEB domain